MPGQFESILDKLQKKLGKQTIRKASSIARPKPRPNVIQMQAINDYVIIDIIKEGPKKVGGLILTDETDESNRYKKANIISVGNMVEVVKEGDSIYYDALAGHDIAYNDIMYKVIRARDIVIVE